MTKAKQGLRVLMAETLVKDHRINPGEDGRRWRLGDVITDDDLADRDRYPEEAPNTWAWVWGGLVAPVGYERYVVAEEIPDSGPKGANPKGYIRKGDVVTEKHFPAHVNIEALVDGGQLVSEASATTPKEE